MVEATPPQDDQAGRRHSLVQEFAHELRDALSPIAASLELLRLPEARPDQGRLVAERIERGLQAAVAVIQAFTLAEECENGSLRLETGCWSLEQILGDARRALPAPVSERCAFAPTSAGVAVTADLGRAAQVVGAMVRSADAMAIPGSGLQVLAAAVPGRGEIRVTGRSAAAKGSDVFSGFRARGHGGVALRTARQLMVLQGGGLEFSARPTGEFELVASFLANAGEQPQQSAAQARDGGQTGPRGSPQSAPRRLIIVDDSVEVRRSYRESLEALGYRVMEAGDGAQALRSLDGEAPEVALVDIHLPDMSGYRLAQALKARAGPAIRLIMLSGVTLDDTTRRLSREAGFDDCLDKLSGPLALHRMLQA